MPATPFFSVIIPTYNRANFIGKAIKSVIGQTFTDWEIIITDDASTDNTAEIVKPFLNERISYYKNPVNFERSFNRNMGISYAAGKYNCFLDSDDWFLENHLKNFYVKIVETEQPTAIFFGSAVNLYHDKQEKRIYPDITKYNKFGYILKHTFGLPLSCIHADIFKDFLLDSDIVVCEDMDFFLRAVLRFPIIQVDTCEYIYNLHDECFTIGNPNKPFMELDSYKKIFARIILKHKLPSSGKRRLLSMCYFQIAQIYEQQNKWLKMYSAIFKSFFLFPQSYNGKTNKIMLVMFLYNFPVLGDFIKFIRKA